MRRIALGVIGALVAAPASAAPAPPLPPPPPPIYPDDLARELDGYNLQVYYTAYRAWIEQHKGQAVDRRLSDVPDVPGYTPFAPAISYRKIDMDMGHFQSGELRQFCKAAPDDRGKYDDCFLVMRWAYVPDSASAWYTYSPDNPFTQFVRDTFIPAKLVANLRAAAIAPEADPWSVSLDDAFAGMGDPVSVYAQAAHVEMVDSRHCPALQSAFSALERSRYSVLLDFSDEGADADYDVPGPHSWYREDTVNIVTPRGPVSITGTLNSLYKVVRPIYDAADGCHDREGDDGEK